MTKKIMILLLALLAGWAILPGCSPNQAEINQVRRHTDPVADRMMKALDQNNYSEFSADFDENMKATLPEAKFQELRSYTKANKGTYLSTSFFSLIRNPDSLIIQYYVMFTNKNATSVLMLVFNHPDGSGLVTGFDLGPIISR